MNKNAKVENTILLKRKQRRDNLIGKGGWYCHVGRGMFQSLDS